ncbi:MAG: DUF1801 domain-containing protein [Actinobacteria bacterium]|nr:DUF1801 domain-containing protein [Actinomycetota bacterium]
MSDQTPGDRAAKSAQPGDIDDYLADLPREERAVLERLRETVRAAAPEAVETVKYKIPVFKHHGDLVGFAAQKDFMSFYVMSPDLVKEKAADIEGFEVSGATIHFLPDRPLPAALVTELVKARVEENEKEG